MTERTLRSEKVLAFWRRAISLKRGCCQVPVCGVDGVDWARGVEGAFEGVDAFTTAADILLFQICLFALVLCIYRIREEKVIRLLWPC
jgi:hypothetical protein